MKVTYIIHIILYKSSREYNLPSVSSESKRRRTHYAARRVQQRAKCIRDPRVMMCIILLDHRYTEHTLYTLQWMRINFHQRRLPCLLSSPSSHRIGSKRPTLAHTVVRCSSDAGGQRWGSWWGGGGLTMILSSRPSRTQWIRAELVTSG